MATFTSVTSGPPRAQGIRAGEAKYGLCCGTKTSQIPNPVDPVVICHNYGISKMWLSPAPVSTTNKVVTSILDRIINDSDLKSEIKICLWIDYKDLDSLAVDEKNAEKWVDAYVRLYKTVIGYVCVGDVTGPPKGNFLLSTFIGAMRNLKKYLSDFSGAIKLSTIVNERFLFGESYTAETYPSTCELTEWSKDLLLFLSRDIGSPIPLFVAIMPYFMISPPGVTVDNCILNPDAKTYMPDNNYRYSQAFDAIVDSICCALEKVGELGGVDIIAVSGWPTKGSTDWASEAYAKQYITNLVNHIGKPTPRKNKPVDIFIYSMVDEIQLDTPVDEFKHLGAIAYLPQP